MPGRSYFASLAERARGAVPVVTPPRHLGDGREPLPPEPSVERAALASAPSESAGPPRMIATRSAGPFPEAAPAEPAPVAASTPPAAATPRAEPAPLAGTRGAVPERAPDPVPITSSPSASAPAPLTREAATRSSLAQPHARPPVTRVVAAEPAPTARPAPIEPPAAHPSATPPLLSPALGAALARAFAWVSSDQPRVVPPAERAPERATNAAPGESPSAEAAPALDAVAAPPAVRSAPIQRLTPPETPAPEQPAPLVAGPAEGPARAAPSAEIERPTLSIGKIHVEIVAPPRAVEAPRAARPRPAPPAPLARDFLLPFGLRQTS